MGPGPAPEVRRRVWETGEKKKIPKVLERWPLALKASPGGLEKSRPRKRLQKTQIGKEFKARKTEIEGRKQGLMEKWLQREEKGSESFPQSSRKRQGIEKNQNQQEKAERNSEAKDLSWDPKPGIFNFTSM